MSTANSQSATQNHRFGDPSTEGPKSQKPYQSRIDTGELHWSVRQILNSELNKFQQKLNSELINQLCAKFADWIANKQSEIDLQLKTIPHEHRQKWLQERLSLDRRDPENNALRYLCDFFLEYFQVQLQEIDQLKKGNHAFRRMVAKASSVADRQELTIQYAGQLGASGKQLELDRRSFSRWFDEEAVIDRFQKRVGQTELLLSFAFERAAQTILLILEKVETEYVDAIWQRLNFEARVQQAVASDCDVRVHVSALRSLRRLHHKLTESAPGFHLQAATVLLVSRAATNRKLDVWFQCESLAILGRHSFDTALPIYKQRIQRQTRDDDMFVRRHIWQLLESQIQESQIQNDTNLKIADCFVDDPSEFVRKQMASVFFLSDHAESIEVWHKLRETDPVPQVRAAALVAALNIVIDEKTNSAKRVYTMLDGIARSLESEENAFVARAALHVATEFVERLSLRVGDSTVSSIYRTKIMPLILQLQNEHDEISVRRRAAHAYQRIWAQLDQQARGLIRELRPKLQKISPGRSEFFPASQFSKISKQKLGRIFAVLAQDDFGYDLFPAWYGMRIGRGPKFGFRLWRFIYEFTNTATDKRQALRHTVGRISTANYRAPSQICGELSETKVPGEPLTINEEGSWRPFLPLPDDFVSVLNKSWLYRQEVRFYTSQGVTLVKGPKGIFRRLRAAYQLNFRFAKLASLRNWDNETYPAAKYIDSFREMGFEIEFERYENDSQDIDAYQSGDEPDHSVSQFFGAAPVVQAAIAIAPVSILIVGSTIGNTIWERVQNFADYFMSPFENTLPQLVVFSVVVLLLFLGKHFYSNYSFRRARNKIPFSIGGWGTRGKSGTERLKAALIGVMGHGLVSKTTGCEAMFIHGYPNGEPLEIPLFRPYDKATIWEHRNLIVMASKMEPSVFLWECMALNPNYVDVLQRQWTCDDLATITNTYPDHEDIQGPAGHDVAKTISGFVPLKSHLVTTEEIMRPYVTESCRLAGSTFEGVGWLESGLVTDDVLDRFPYREHPDNIALVCAMAAHLGCSYEFSLKAMADYLVPDLGVLKTSPVAKVRTRKFEFTNGCSANERFGCMGNWKRLEFDAQDPWEQSTTWVCGVVNNRADRVPRSKVFAKIIVEDVNADRFFLIGSNLEGLQTFISDAWDEKAATISLRDRDKPWDVGFALEVVKQAAWDFRQPTEPAHVKSKLHCMIDAVGSEIAAAIDVDLESIWDDPEQLLSALESAGIDNPKTAAINKHHTQLLASLGEYHEIREMIEDAPESITETVTQKFVEVLRKWYQRKIVVIPKLEATGEEVIHTIVEEIPPGFLAKVMGLQNIKGTGLDFVYRFQAWDTCNEACKLVRSRQPKVAEKGLAALVAMPAIGQLCREQIRETIKFGRTSDALKRVDLQDQLDVLQERIAAETDDQVGAVDTEVGETSSQFITSMQKWLLESAEQFLDVNDSVRRRDVADQIYDDLAACRISRQRAVVELRKINKRQKGGWLAAELDKSK